MINKIKILCPPRRCRKCSRIVRETEAVLKMTDIDFELVIESRSEEFLKYPTWILPTIVINGHVAARGYASDMKTILQYIHK
ncbi:MAG: thioredoxin family protein [Bacteroidales bacterium]|nr:thioredoxin family protein [Bacteroidales bacterium]